MWVAPAAIAWPAGASVNGPAPTAEPPAGAAPLDAVAVQVAPVTSRLGSEGGCVGQRPVRGGGAGVGDGDGVGRGVDAGRGRAGHAAGSLGGVRDPRVGVGADDRGAVVGGSDREPVARGRVGCAGARQRGRVVGGAPGREHLVEGERLSGVDGDGAAGVDLVGGVGDRDQTGVVGATGRRDRDGVVDVRTEPALVDPNLGALASVDERARQVGAADHRRGCDRERATGERRRDRRTAAVDARRRGEGEVDRHVLGDARRRVEGRQLDRRSTRRGWRPTCRA